MNPDTLAVAPMTPAEIALLVVVLLIVAVAFACIIDAVTRPKDWNED